MLELRELQFAYPHRVLFQNLSHTITPGQATLVSGPNGAGKSTLLSVIMGFLRPTSGEVLWNNSNDMEEFKTECEYLHAESNGLFLKLDALTNLQFWLDLRQVRVSEAEILETLRKWGLGGPVISRLPVEKFSTGMRRRLALSRMMLSNTKLWIMDEPIYGLDAEAINLFRRMLKEHLTRGGQALLVSHDRPATEGLIDSEITIGGKK
jgi:heme exporter protein A